MVALSQSRVPSFVPVLNPLLRRLVRLGVPMGPNGVITVRGRKSGTPRTTAVAVIESGGRRWVVGTFGDVNWVRNLRAAREAIVIKGRRRETLHATELTRDEAKAFFTDVVVPYIGRSALKRFLLAMLGAADILEDPAGAAMDRPVFELR